MILNVKSYKLIIIFEEKFKSKIILKNKICNKYKDKQVFT